MPAYKVRVTDAEGRLVVGATLWCPDDERAVRRFEALPLPPGRAELCLRQRVIARRELFGRQAAEWREKERAADRSAASPGPPRRRPS